MNIKNVLICLDGTENSFKAFNYALNLFEKFNNINFFVIYVVDVATLLHLLKVKVIIQSEYEQLEKDLENDGKKYLKLAEDIALKINKKINTIIAKGNVVEEVKKAINENNIDLVVIGKLQAILS
ncbi:MAG TPA: universal stress protein [bacterium]|nr:universal stress protein [bacterium]HOL48436.1 universal stress protein [bacterium]HPQ18678.1 universal stress protein [bacterium]